MANISSARGTLTLQGPWGVEDITRFVPVLDTWKFYGEYGIQSYDTRLSVRHMSTGFYGCGRWSFSGTVASFDEWTRDWIKNRGPLTQEQYNTLLQVMQEKELSILIEFDDNEEGFGFAIHETGVMTSDGECLNYEMLSHGGQQSTWQELGWRAFRRAVLFFSGFVSEPDEFKIRKWVKAYVPPMRGVQWGYDVLGQLLLEEEGVLDDELLADFARRFHPDTEAWKNVSEYLSADIFKSKLDRLRDTLAELKDIRQVAVDPVDHIYFLHRDGTVSDPQGNQYPWTDVCEIAAAQTGLIVRKSDGTVDGILFVPGEQPGDENMVRDDSFKAWSDIVSITAGALHVAGLKGDGTVVAAGARLPGIDACDVGDWRDITAISAGGLLTAGICKDGTIRCTPIEHEEFKKQYAYDFSSWRDIRLLSVGGLLAAGLRGDGHLLSTGLIREEFAVEECEGSKPFTALAIGGTHLLGLRPDGTVFAAGLRDAGQCDVEDWTGIVSIAAGGSLSFGVKADGTVVVAGDFQEDVDDDYLNSPDEEFEFPKGEVSLEDYDDESDELWNPREPDEFSARADVPPDSGEPVTVKDAYFTVTGDFAHCDNDRDQIKSIIEAKGGHFRGTVSGKTNYLVLGSKGGWGDKKRIEARRQMELGSDIRIIGEDALFAALGDWECDTADLAQTRNQEREERYERFLSSMPSEPFLQEDGSLSTLSYPYDTPSKIDFADKTFCTGLMYFTDKYSEIIRQIEDRGGRCTFQVSGRTDYLVISETISGNREELLHEALECREKKGKPIFLRQKDLEDFLSHS